jgi:hypothetical protein
MLEALPLLLLINKSVLVMQADLAPMQDEEDVKRPREENGHANGHAQVQHRPLNEHHHAQDCQMQLRQAIGLWCTVRHQLHKFTIQLVHALAYCLDRCVQGTKVPHKHLSAEGSSRVKSPVCLWHLCLMHTSLCILFSSIMVCA